MAFGQSATQNWIFVKVKNSGTPAARSASFDLSSFDGVLSYEPIQHGKSNARNIPSVLDGLHKVRVDKSTDLKALCQELEADPNIEYAEPIAIPKLLYIPDDPDATNGNQDYLDVIHAFEAWDITKGSSDMVIGISDTGLDFTQQDINPKLFINKNDPPNGVDDDNNGYIDDYRGYDFADNDSIASTTTNKHGTLVGGLAGAATDNGYGIAGVGFNTKISSLKSYSDTNKGLFGGYEAIIYAADNGYDVINLSWGEAGGYSQAVQDIITYAVNKGVIVVAAAGNTNKDEKFYPASYEGVLSVCASNLNDTKASFSTYNYSVDLMAPGSSIYSTSTNDSFLADNGTSYSSPQTAGAAALVKSVFPNLTNLQIAQRIRVSADTVYNRNGNQNYQDKLGFGRLNIYRAVSADTLRSIRFHNVHYSNSIDEVAYPGDTISFTFDAVNYLFETNAQLTFSSESPYVNLLTDTYELGHLNTLDSTSVELPLFVLSEDTPPETYIPIRVNISDTDYEDFQYLELTTEADLLTLNNGAIAISASGRGNLGFDKDGFYDGIGLKWNTTTMAARLGIFLAVDTNQVSNNMPSTPLSTDKNKDFAALQTIRYDHQRDGILQATSTFADDSAASPINIEIKQKLITIPDADYLIHEYLMINRSSEDRLINFGYYVDWALPVDIRANKAYYDPTSKVLISINQDSSIYTGIKTYFDNTPIGQAYDIDSKNGNTADLTDSLTDSVLYQLATRQLFDSAGMVSAGNDISVSIAQDSITIAPTHTQKSTFIMGFGHSLNELMLSLNAADSLYNSLLQKPEKLLTYLSCSGAPLNIIPDSGVVFRYYSDPMGQNMISENDSLITGSIYQDTVFYAARLVDGLEQQIQTIEVVMVEQVANFLMSTDTLFLDSAINIVRFKDQSFKAIEWSWDFGNGQQATIQNPEMYYNKAGSYDISLSVINSQGCDATTSQTLLVANRPPIPTLSDYEICQGESLTISATNADTLAAYTSANSKVPVATGASISIKAIEHDTTLFFTNITGPFESLKTEVNITVDQANATFKYYSDTTSAQTGALFINTSKDSKSHKWYLDQNPVSGGDTLSFIVDKASYEVALTVTNTTGCKDSLNTVINFSTSPTPTVSFEQPCLNSDFTLTPGNGTVFGFYRDNALSDLIKKGKSLYFTNMKDSLSVYIVGLDSVLPSSSIKAHIVPNQPHFSIQATPDTLYLTDQLTATFSTTGDELTSWKWFINGEFVETSSNPKLLLDSAATYEVVLQGTDDLSCVNSDTISYHVYKARPVIILSSEFSRQLIYPNPASNVVNLQFTKAGMISFSDLSGNIILTQAISHPQNLDISLLKPGIYIIQYATEGRVFVSKLVVE